MAVVASKVIVKEGEAYREEAPTITDYLWGDLKAAIGSTHPNGGVVVGMSGMMLNAANAAVQAGLGFVLGQESGFKRCQQGKKTIIGAIFRRS